MLFCSCRLQHRRWNPTQNQPNVCCMWKVLKLASGYLSYCDPKFHQICFRFVTIISSQWISLCLHCVSYFYESNFNKLILSAVLLGATLCKRYRLCEIFFIEDWVESTRLFTVELDMKGITIHLVTMYVAKISDLLWSDVVDLSHCYCMSWDRCWRLCLSSILHSHRIWWDYLDTIFQNEAWSVRRLWFGKLHSFLNRTISSRAVAIFRNWKTLCKFALNIFNSNDVTLTRRWPNHTIVFD